MISLENFSQDKYSLSSLKLTFDSIIDCPKCLETNNYDTTDRFNIQFNDLPSLNIMSPVSNIPHLTDLDVDLDMPSDHNFNYYSPHDFHGNHDTVFSLEISISISAEVIGDIKKLSGEEDFK